MKIYLATFYSFDLKRSAERFQRQAKAMNIYDNINIFSPNDLNQDFKDFILSLLKKGKQRGYGHWVWQTYIHQLMLKKMNENDIYHWCDVGCHFNIKGINRLKEYIEIVSKEKNGFLGFTYKKPELLNKFKNYKFASNYEYQYTKADLLKFFQLKKDDIIVNSPQVWGGSFFIRKCSESQDILNKHYEITRNRYDLIDDDENKFIEKSLPGFIAHRHSQSVLSILAKKKNCKFLSAYESEWALDENGQRTFEHTSEFPVIAKRDKQKNIFYRFLDRQKKNVKRRIGWLKKFDFKF